MECLGAKFDCQTLLFNCGAYLLLSEVANGVLFSKLSWLNMAPNTHSDASLCTVKGFPKSDVFSTG